jgi:flagellar biosynthesis protein FlhB
MARSGEATEAPTPKRLDEARRRGEVAYSRDLVSAGALLAAIAALIGQGAASTARLMDYLRLALGSGLTGAASGGDVGAALAAGAGVAARVLVAPLGAAAIAALALGLAQTRGLFAPAAVRFDLGRLSPADGLARLFGAQAAAQMGKGLVKVALVALLAWSTVRPLLFEGGLPALAGADAPRLAAAWGAVAGRLALRVALAALVLGAFDYLLARRRHQRGLRMSHDEVKRESRESEGDPHHRAERQRLHRELTEQRMVEDVRRADFVVVNPDHIAIALRYDRDGEGAPVVVASGERLVAARIKEVAREAGVPIFRDVTLARSLRELAEGAEIPVALYEAVAELLRVVYAMEPPPSGPVGGGAPPAASLPRGAGWKRA